MVVNSVYRAIVVGFRACLLVSQVSRYSRTVRLVRLTSVIRVRTIACRALWAAALVAKPDLLVCNRAPLLSRPYSRTYRHVPLQRCVANEPSGSRGQSRV